MWDFYTRQGDLEETNILGKTDIVIGLVQLFQIGFDDWQVGQGRVFWNVSFPVPHTPFLILQVHIPFFFKLYTYTDPSN